MGIVENHSNDFLGEGFVLEPDVGEPDFAECDWSDFNPEASEALPPNAPKPLGKGVPLGITFGLSNSWWVWCWRGF